ncbi:DUF3397 family protein [Streptococcus cuniculipharyngis]|uniref:DUF3397 domain-containing protein n=1 Tax=Streptococcus cuniculipharyngis TaxID=1562651 RepID=A0A5C5SH37_9STRE|nr:DUF3397 family protein [Streptococcus cuniculipharyngis]TWS99255.1 DUF3397 domain-containing protein [Streptococcus cuniculipharyngis]
MTFYKFLALGLLVLTPLLSLLITKLFQLDKLGLRFPDLAFPLFAGQIIYLSGHFFTHSLLPHYAIALALLAICAAIWLLNKQPNHFSYRRFFKVFWRTGFLVTLVFYLSMLIAIFLQK